MMTESIGIVERAMNFPMAIVTQRYIEDTGVSEEKALQHEYELKRFLAICAIVDGRISMKGPIDKLWHTFIIFTKLYAEFCDEVAGRFIHHCPVPSGERSRREARLGYVRFHKEYVAIFGEEPSNVIWPQLLGAPDNTLTDGDGGGGSGDCGGCDGNPDCHAGECF